MWSNDARFCGNVCYDIFPVCATEFPPSCDNPKPSRSIFSPGCRQHRSEWRLIAHERSDLLETSRGISFVNNVFLSFSLFLTPRFSTQPRFENSVHTYGDYSATAFSATAHRRRRHPHDSAAKMAKRGATTTRCRRRPRREED